MSPELLIPTTLGSEVSVSGHVIVKIS